MPIYTYQCESCGVRFERQQKFSDTPLTRCPECSKKALRKVYTPVGIVFKGSGFYATDHKSPSRGGRATPAKSDETEKKPDTSSDSSPKSAETKSAETESIDS
jgi:putative FmdB family regulatory protein